MEKQKKLVFENGKVLYGTGFGADKQQICEIVCNTAMIGYQEVFSDNSYCGQFVCLTYPLIGGYGLAEEDYEARIPQVGGLIVGEYIESLANFRASKTLSEAMEEYNIPGITGVDTRTITRMLHKEGSMKALLCDIDLPEEQAKQLLQETEQQEKNLVKQVSCKKRWYARTAGVLYTIVVVDCGVKMGMIRSLLNRKCNVTVVPYDTTAEEILELSPDGVIFSSGPGNPEKATEVIEIAKGLFGRVPLLGVGLGHQILALAAGASVYPLANGRHGSNYPVKCVQSGKLITTTQAVQYSVEKESVSKTDFKITHENILDKSVEGLACSSKKIFTAQFYPETSPGIEDSTGILDKFIANMEANRKGGQLHA